MAITRKFLDWHAPILPAAAGYLVDRYATAGRLNLSDVLVVVPGRRAGRLLIEVLVEKAGAASLALVPPAVETMGQLPEQLYEPKRSFAPELVQRFAWARALQGMPAARLEPLMVRPPTGDHLLDWIELGDVLWKQYRELAGDGLSFADVAVKTTGNAWSAECRRWQLLGELQTAYLAILHDLNLWDRQTARLTAVEHRECRSSKDIVLVATADMNRTVRAMLGQAAERVTALVHAPESCSDRFDEFGCLAPEAWQEVSLPLEDRHLHLASDPASQADVVARTIAGYHGQYRADEITIGVPDETMVPPIQRRLEQLGLPTRLAIGKTLPETTPYQLLKAMADLVGRNRFADFAALLRHTDVSHWIRRQGWTDDVISELDHYFAEHLPSQLGQWLGKADACRNIGPIHRRVEKLVQPLTGPARPMAEWSEGLAALMSEIYEGVTLNDEVPGERETLAACRAIGNALAAFTTVPAAMAVACTAGEAIRLLLDQLAGQTVPPQSQPEAIEMLGWLELPTDPSPALIVTSVNEGFVPSSLNSDLFLPDALRRHLKLLDNRRRYARDAYAMSVLLASRRELTLVVGRRDAGNNPLVPSRLLFAADSETIVRRAKTFFDSEATVPLALPSHDDDAPEASAFEVPRPVPQAEPMTSMRVTAFRDYLACPYRFYLRHVLKLESLDDSEDEMGPPTFGNLIHAVAQEFAESPVRDSTVAGEIDDFLIGSLDATAAKWFGNNPLAAVVVQLEQCRARLRALARWQADWRAAGWRIERAEQAAEPFLLAVDADRSIAVRGRIDRIDRNEQTGEWAVLDYKTSNTATPPDKLHRKSDAWVDLQLPLYRHMVRSMGIEGPVQLGYIVIPKELDKVGERMAEWTDAELDEADVVARDIARCVLDQQFWPPTEPAPAFFDDVAAICQDGVFGARVGDVAVEGDWS